MKAQMLHYFCILFAQICFDLKFRRAKGLIFYFYMTMSIVLLLYL